MIHSMLQVYFNTSVVFWSANVPKSKIEGICTAWCQDCKRLRAQIDVGNMPLLAWTLQVTAGWCEVGVISLSGFRCISSLWLKLSSVTGSHHINGTLQASSGATIIRSSVFPHTSYESCLTLDSEYTMFFLPCCSSARTKKHCALILLFTTIDNPTFFASKRARPHITMTSLHSLRSSDFNKT